MYNDVSLVLHVTQFPCSTDLTCLSKLLLLRPQQSIKHFLQILQHNDDRQFRNSAFGQGSFIYSFICCFWDVQLNCQDEIPVKSCCFFFSLKTYLTSGKCIDTHRLFFFKMQLLYIYMEYAVTKILKYIYTSLISLVNITLVLSAV